MKPWRLLVVDDSRVFVEGLRAYVNQEARVELVGHATTPAEALEACRRLKPDLVLLDLRLPENVPVGERQLVREADAARGLVLLREMVKKWPRVRVLATSSVVEDWLVVEAMLAGAKGFVDRNSEPGVLLDALKRVGEGQLVLTQYHFELLMARKRLHLTERELEILSLVCEGLTNRQIAGRLGLRESTVRKYVEDLRHKFHARTRGEVCAKAYRLGLVREALSPSPDEG